MKSVMKEVVLEIVDEKRERLGSIHSRLLSRGVNSGEDIWTNLKGKNTDFKIAEVNGELFHDIFEINRQYLPNGELVDLHEKYDNCKCYLSKDGLCGFAIEKNGNLVSVFPFLF